MSASPWWGVLLSLAFATGSVAEELPKSPWDLVGLSGPARGLSDVLPVCAPGAGVPELVAVVELARRGALDHALLVLKGRGGGPGEAAPYTRS